MPKTFEKDFISYCNNQELEVNPNQIAVIKKLEQYYQSNFKSFFSKLFSKQNSKKGFYLFGGVGVGKTMILNFIFDQVDQKKLRQHFNEFMLSFHDFVHERKDKNEENVINQFVKNLKSKSSLIYFDEFQVTNIVDAMILGKLFDQIFKEDIKIMANQSIEHELKIEDDYRKSNDNQKQRYFYPLNQETNFKINKFFRTITKDKNQSKITVNVKGRDFKIENFYEGIARFNFNDLCDQNLGAEDYLEIIKDCKFIVIDQIPQFNDANSNQQQRFITLLDVIYDKNISIAVTSNQSLDKFTSSRLLEKPFKRTISRLYELTSRE